MTTTTPTITLQDPEKQAELNQHIEAANQAKTAFLAIQQQAQTIKDNIDKNQGVKLALEAENTNLINASKNAVIGESGEVDFSRFDDLTSQIELNKDKIAILEKTITKFSHKLELILLTDYRNAENKVIHLTREAYNYLAQHYLDELFNDEALKNKIAIFCTLFKQSNPVMTIASGFSNRKNEYLASFSEKLKPLLNDELNITVENLSFPQIDFYSGDETTFRLTRRIEELNQAISSLDA